MLRMKRPPFPGRDGGRFAWNGRLLLVAVAPGRRLVRGAVAVLFFLVLGVLFLLPGRHALGSGVGFRAGVGRRAVGRGLRPLGAGVGRRSVGLRLACPCGFFLAMAGAVQRTAPNSRATPASSFGIMRMGILLDVWDAGESGKSIRRFAPVESGKYGGKEGMPYATPAWAFCAASSFFHWKMRKTKGVRARISGISRMPMRTVAK